MNKDVSALVTNTVVLCRGKRATVGFCLNTACIPKA